MTQISYNGKTITLKQDAYMTNYRDRVCYEALGEYEDNGETVTCMVRWELTPEYAEASARYTETEDAEYLAIVEDESNACDWENPAEVVEL